MNSFLKWLGKKLFRQEPVRNSTLQHTVSRSNAAVKVNPGSKATPNSSASRRAEVSNAEGARIEDGGPGKNVYVRNKYIREDSGTHESLKIIDESLLEDDDADGLDPYNTGRFDRSKTWKIRS
jgi:hypothetical protein